MIFDKEFMGDDVDEPPRYVYNYTDIDDSEQKYDASLVMLSLGIISLFCIHVGLRVYHVCCSRINTHTFSQPESLQTRMINVVEAKGEELNQECPICLSHFTESPKDVENSENTNNLVIKLRCNHCFHKECLKEWLENHLTCPLCRNVA